MSGASPPPPARGAAQLASLSRWRPLEFVFWALVVAAWFAFPDRYLLIAEIAVTALFALSLDLVLGYAGILSLGHAAFFGLGAYVAGIAAARGLTDPLLGLLLAGGAATLLGGVTSPLVLRGSDLTRLMVTLGVASLLYEVANRLNWLTGGADGLQGMEVAPILGLFEFDLGGQVASVYSLVVLFLSFLVVRRVVHSPFGWSLRAVRGNPLRAGAIGIPVNARLMAAYTLGAGIAGLAGAVLAQSTQFVSLDVLAFHRSADILLVLVIGGVGWLYGGLIGAVIFKLMQDVLSGITPQYWQFWIGLVLVVLVLVGRERLNAWPARLLRRRARPAPVAEAAE
ncbi:branched-chain amino acid ABC transporter permease [Roseomonas sp. OT10]|uniref:branched-chain amino acid ABC transporter permease n=1 Tax=Roseomonas cutis TaxID=2897332 RepID=UPI001E2B363B|nr:branched-chain amino acid ABC transporter permease [Roseomonas sp. OT10]UFN47192.1 branched-chain amino acid ABC transporter permease [Roseomonas sp. OT10]